MDGHLKRLQREIDAVVAGTSAGYRLPDAGKWSAAEVLEHLYLSYTGTIKGFERVRDSGNLSQTHPTWKHKFGTLLVVGIGYFPSGRESPATARPRGLPPEQVRTDISASISRLDAILEQCEEKFGSRAKVLDHPLLGPFTVGQWRKFHLVHGLHHVKQIRRLQATGWN